MKHSPKVYNGRSVDSKKPWVTVRRFSTEPRDHPIRSKEGQIVAKFVGVGDAWAYCKGKIDAYDPDNATQEPLFGFAIN